MKINNQQQQPNHSQFEYDVSTNSQNLLSQAGDPINSRSPLITNSRVFGISSVLPHDVNNISIKDEQDNISNSIQEGIGESTLSNLKISQSQFKNIISVNNGEQKGAEQVYGMIKQTSHDPKSRVANSHLNRNSSQQNIGDQGLNNMKDQKGKTVKKKHPVMYDNQNAFEQQSNLKQFNPMSSFGHSSYLLNTPDQQAYKIEPEDRNNLSSMGLAKDGVDNYFDNSIKLNNSNMVHSSSIQFIRNNQRKLNSSVQIYDNLKPGQVSQFKSKVDYQNNKNEETHKALSSGPTNNRNQTFLQNNQEPLKSQEE